MTDEKLKGCVGGDMSKPIAFVCGPYRGKTDAEQAANIQTAAEAARSLWRHGYAVICPHTNSAWFSGIVPEQELLDGYKEILAKCDLVVRLPGWLESEGSRAEVAEAQIEMIDIVDFRHVVAAAAFGAGTSRTLTTGRMYKCRGNSRR